uniref:Uncharacterized protein n=1 Tax=Nelumbo nucifera TaxID=4432 RepID=A0A822XRX8_NELNU|nr:TPA_asm: hypothetical protein HUJ06_025818 [Nelumbo nucifera]
MSGFLQHFFMEGHYEHQLISPRWVSDRAISFIEAAAATNHESKEDQHISIYIKEQGSSQRLYTFEDITLKNLLLDCNFSHQLPQNYHRQLLHFSLHNQWDIGPRWP